MNEEDAFNYMITWIRNPPRSDFHSCGYEFYLPNVIRSYLADHEGLAHPRGEERLRELSPIFYAAAWELCRLGVLRPGIKRYGEQATDDGASGNGYSVTPGSAPLPGVCRDRSDDAILVCAVAAHADFLVTGDDDLIELRTFQKIRIIRPRGFEALFTD